MTPFIWTSAGAAQRSGYPHKLSYYGGLGGWWWCRHLTGSTYLQYSTVQYGTAQYSHRSLCCPLCGGRAYNYISLFMGCYYSQFLF